MVRKFGIGINSLVVLLLVLDGGWRLVNSAVIAPGKIIALVVYGFSLYVLIAPGRNWTRKLGLALNISFLLVVVVILVTDRSMFSNLELYLEEIGLSVIWLVASLVNVRVLGRRAK